MVEDGQTAALSTQATAGAWWIWTKDAAARRPFDGSSTRLGGRSRHCTDVKQHALAALFATIPTSCGRVKSGMAALEALYHWRRQGSGRNTRLVFSCTRWRQGAAARPLLTANPCRPGSPRLSPRVVSRAGRYWPRWREKARKVGRGGAGSAMILPLFAAGPRRRAGAGGTGKPQDSKSRQALGSSIDELLAAPEALELALRPAAGALPRPQVIRGSLGRAFQDMRGTGDRPARGCRAIPGNLAKEGASP